MKPGFIGIGAQKCATTWLYRVLEDHPQAALSQPKELHFFSAHFDRGYRWYERHFDAGAGKLAVGEYSTSYLCSLDAVSRAHAYNRAFRLIVALRDPVERAYSNHLHEVRAGHLGATPLPFEACVDANPMYLTQGLYAAHLQRWLAAFPRERLHVVFQEDIEREPEAQASRLYEFLGIDPSHRSPYLAERVNVSAGQRSAGAKRAMTAGAGALRRIVGDRFVRDLKALPPFSQLRRANQQPLHAVVPPLLPQTRQRLAVYYRADMERLADLLQVPELPWTTWHGLKGVTA